MKQIIQMSIAPAYDGSVPDIIYALTTEGKIYYRPTTKEAWEEFNGIPDESDITQ